jgi:hypothetical protein
MMIRYYQLVVEMMRLNLCIGQKLWSVGLVGFLGHKKLWWKFLGNWKSQKGKQHWFGPG